MGTTNMYYVTTLSAFLALFATIYQGYFTSQELQHITNILSSLTDLEFMNRSSGSSGAKIAVGYGSCSDVYVNGVLFLNRSEVVEADPQQWLASDKIQTRQELLQTFGYFMQRGAAAERLIGNRTLFEELLLATTGTAMIRKMVGMNAPGMANRFAREGAEVLLGADLTEDQMGSMDGRVKLLNGFTTDEDVHLILEYKAGMEWGADVVAPRANRFIVRNDAYNPIIQSLDTFTDAFNDFRPRLFAISGLHVMDNDPMQVEIREQKLQALAGQLRAMDQHTLVHYEMASYVERGYVRRIFDTVIPHADSIGMNEQELQSLEQILTDDDMTVVADYDPPVTKTLTQMRHILKLIHNRSSSGSSRPVGKQLSRIHVHTLGYQAIMTVKGGEWRNARSAAAKAALVAHRYVCGTDFVNPEAAELRLDGPFEVDSSEHRVWVTEKEPVPCWEENHSQMTVEVCVAPVLVCKSAKWTTGAGDNISAAALYLQI